MSDIDSIVLQAGRELAKEATQRVMGDIQTIMDSDEQFQVEPEVAEPPTGLKAADELTPATIYGFKKGYPFPSKPRYRTGAMFHSLAMELGDLTGEVGLTDGDTEKVEYQQETRPFMGVSTRVYGEIEDRLKIYGAGIVDALRNETLEPITA